MGARMFERSDLPGRVDASGKAPQHTHPWPRLGHGDSPVSESSERYADPLGHQSQQLGVVPVQSGRIRELRTLVRSLRNGASVLF